MKHGVVVRQYSFYCIRAVVSREIQLINGTKILKALHVFADNAYLMSG